MKRPVRSVFLLGLVMSVVAGAPLASSAGAAPVWRFGGGELVGSETITGIAVLGKFTVPGLTTTCKRTDYTMTISNLAGTGVGEVTALPFKTCATSSKVCTVKTMAAEKLPWQVHLATFGTGNYVAVEGIKVSIVYAGEECALGGTLVTVKGSVAGLYDNGTETFAFNAANSKAAKAELKALGSAIEWNAAFTTEATGAHSGQALTIE